MLPTSDITENFKQLMKKYTMQLWLPICRDSGLLQNPKKRHYLTSDSTFDNDLINCFLPIYNDTSHSTVK